MIKAGRYKRATNLNRAFVSIIFSPREVMHCYIRTKSTIWEESQSQKAQSERNHKANQYIHRFRMTWTYFSSLGLLQFIRRNLFQEIHLTSTSWSWCNREHSPCKIKITWDRAVDQPNHSVSLQKKGKDLTEQFQPMIK